MIQKPTSADEPPPEHSRGQVDSNRRTALRLLGTAFGIAALGNTVEAAHAQPNENPKKGTVRKMGQTILEPSPSADVGPHFAEESIRADGQYAVVGVVQGEIGSFLVDMKPTGQ